MKYRLITIFKKIIGTTVFANFVNLSSIQISNSLLIVLIYPIITRIVGIEEFGFVGLANTFAGLSGMVINYGTNQSAVRDIARAKANPEEISRIFYNTLFIRVIIFILFLVGFFFLQWLNIKYYSFLLLAIPLVLAEVLNPLFFYLGKENLNSFNIANLISRIAILILIIVIIKGPNDSKWVNFIMGTVNTITYGCLLIYAIVKFQLSCRAPQKQVLLKTCKENFFLTGNNISVQLQQSIMIFSIGKWGTASWLGAYWLCDKIVWSSRLLISSISNSMYPKAAHLYQEGNEVWQKFMKRTKGLLTISFFGFSLALFFLAEPIIHIIVGNPDPTAISLLKIMAFVPTVAALNSLNVVDLLLKNDNVSIFRIAMILLVLAILLSVMFVITAQVQLFGYYILIIDLCGLLMYEYVVKRSFK